MLTFNDPMQQHHYYIEVTISITCECLFTVMPPSSRLEQFAIRRLLISVHLMRTEIIMYIHGSYLHNLIIHVTSYSHALYTIRNKKLTPLMLSIIIVYSLIHRSYSYLYCQLTTYIVMQNRYSYCPVLEGAQLIEFNV